MAVRIRDSGRRARQRRLCIGPQAARRLPQMRGPGDRVRRTRRQAESRRADGGRLRQDLRQSHLGDDEVEGGGAVINK